MENITFDPERFKALKTAYEKAVKEGLDQFNLPFAETPFLTSYAKYLIEYLKPKFEK